MFLVAGLGNPGEEYEFTPHNLGFLVVDRLAAGTEYPVNAPRFQGADRGGSGGAAGQAADLHELERHVPQAADDETRSQSVSDLILVYDELDLPWGEIRIRPKGRAGSHNGLISVVQNLGTEEFVRVRVGAHPGHSLEEGGVNYLLSPFSRQQKKELDDLSGFAAEAVSSIIAEGVEKSMTKFNRRAPGLNIEEE